MGKITVKHYLNKKLGRERKDGKITYPIYVQITAQRRTTQIKSLLNLYFTENEFNQYLDNELKCVTSDDEINKISLSVDFENLQIEKTSIRDILKYCIDYKNIKIGKIKISEVLQFYSKNIITEFSSYIWHIAKLDVLLLAHKETAPIMLHLSTNNNPFSILEAIQSVTKFNIFDKLNKEQKTLIFSFNDFVNKIDFEYCLLIYWYNGKLKKIIENKEQINIFNKISSNLELNFWDNLK